MKSILRIVLTLLIIILFINCSNKKRDFNESTKTSSFNNLNKDIVLVDLDTLNASLAKYSDFYCSVKYVPLETTDDALIGKIKHIQLINDTLYILDGTSAKSLFVFNFEGRFIRKIGKVGKGPGENIQPMSFSIDETKNEIYILDESLQKINVYKKDGSFKRQIILSQKVRSSCLRINQNKLYLDTKPYLSQSTNYLLRELDNDGQNQELKFDLKRYNKGWNKLLHLEGAGTIFKGTDDLKFVELFMDTIFSISSSEIRPFVAIRSKDIISRNELSEIMKIQNDNVLVETLLQKTNKIWGIHNYIENDDLIHFLFKRKISYNEIIISKESMKPMYIKGLVDDLTFMEEKVYGYLPRLYCGEKKTIVGEIVNLVSFQKNLKTYKNHLSSTETNLLLSLPPDSNPVLIFLTTK